MSGFRRWLYIAVRIFCGGMVAAALLLCMQVFFRFPFSYDREALLAAETPSFLTDSSGAYITNDQAQPEGLAQVPQKIRDVFVAAEDKRFYSHGGIDPLRIFGALLANLKSGERSQGGSTITQQLVKMRLLSPEKSYLRKALEAIFALQVEQDLDKEQILSLYLQSAYFGKGATGLAQAARAYFNKEAESLTLTEAASLAAALKAPSAYAPHISEEKNARRREYILSTMQELHWISDAQYDAAVSAPLVLQQSAAPSSNWYADAAFEEAAQKLHLSVAALKTSGYRIETYCDSVLQKKLDSLFTMDALFPPDADDGTPCQAAAVLLDTQRSRVLALAGGRRYESGQSFNRAVDMLRQPGSAIKPLAVYAPALQRRFCSASTLLLDEPTDFHGYAPRNFGEKYYGTVSLRTAAALSLNIPAVKLLDAMGPYAGLESLRRFGIEADPRDAGLSLAVGAMTYGVSPLSLCAGYAALGSGGQYREATLVRAIYDSKGKLLYMHDGEAQEACDAQSAYVTTNLLTSAASWGTAKKLRALSLPIAAKTGTVGMGGELSGNKDAWCAAYTPKFCFCCWMGFDLPDAMHCLPASVTGGSLPTELALHVFEALPNNDAEFAVPDGVVWVNTAGPFAEPDYELFIEGTQPRPTPTPLPTPTPFPVPTPFSSFWEGLWEEDPLVPAFPQPDTDADDVDEEAMEQDQSEDALLDPLLRRSPFAMPQQTER